MENSIKEMKLWVREDGANDDRRLLCTIDSSSKWKSMVWFNRLNNCTDEDLIRAASEQRDGWSQCGPWPNAVFEIEAFDYKGNEVAI